MGQSIIALAPFTVLVCHVFAVIHPEVERAM